MRFQASRNIANKCIITYKKYAYFISAFFSIFIFFTCLIQYKKYPDGLTIVILAGVTFLLTLMYIRSVKNDCILINKMIDLIDINETSISLQTFPVSMFLNIINMQPINLLMKRNEVSLKLSNNKYAFNKKYTNNIYLLIYAGDSYLIPEKFYNDFETLKYKIENSD